MSLSIVSNISIIMNNMELQPQIKQLLQSVQRNEDGVLKCLEVFVNLFSNLSDLSNLLYYSDQQYPINIYRVFRRIYEDSEFISNILEKYESSNHQFLQQKDQIIAQQISFMNKIINSDEEINNQVLQSKRKHAKTAYRDTETQGHSRSSRNRIAYLQSELATLNEVLQRNNFEFEQEIKKYNNQFFQMKQTIQHYEVEVQKVQELEMIIDELENKIMILREEKQRDTMIIENMAKKIRFFEKERGGRDAFLSPRASQTLALSPDAAKGLALARSNISSYKRNI